MEPARPPVIRTSGEPERYTPPPSDTRPEWTRHDPTSTASATPERWYEPAPTTPASPVTETPVRSSGSGRGMGPILGAALLFVGQRYVPPGWASATVISLGAIVGCVQLALTIVVPLAAAVVVTCAIALARRPPAPA